MSTNRESTGRPEGAEGRHVPVLRQRCVDLLAPALRTPDAVLVDCTLGMGGHTEAVLEQVPGVRVIGIDRDPQALDLASERLARFGDRFLPARAVYDEIADVVSSHDLPGVQGVLMDLGVSSLQLDETERGFSYAHDAPLDMRMDQSAGITAAEVLNTYDVGELTRVLREYGRNASPGVSPVRSSVAARSSRGPGPTSSPTSCGPVCRRRRDGPAATPPRGPSRRCVSR